jgi:hypothetical protein
MHVSRLVPSVPNATANLACSTELCTPASIGAASQDASSCYVTDCDMALCTVWPGGTTTCVPRVEEDTGDKIMQSCTAEHVCHQMHMGLRWQACARFDVWERQTAKLHETPTERVTGVMGQ